MPEPSRRESMALRLTVGVGVALLTGCNALLPVEGIHLGLCQAGCGRSLTTCRQRGPVSDRDVSDSVPARMLSRTERGVHGGAQASSVRRARAVVCASVDPADDDAGLDGSTIADADLASAWLGACSMARASAAHGRP